MAVGRRARAPTTDPQQAQPAPVASEFVDAVVARGEDDRGARPGTTRDRARLPSRARSSRRSPEPSRRIVQSELRAAGAASGSVRTKTSCLPFGDQSASESVWPDVSRRSPEPFALLRQSSLNPFLDVPPCVARVNTSSCPFGDQRGSEAFEIAICSVLPSGRRVKSPAPSPAGGHVSQLPEKARSPCGSGAGAEPASATAATRTAVTCTPAT